MSYFLNIAIGIDQFVNVIFAGDPDETLSSRAHRMRVKGHRWWGWTADAIDGLFFWQADHCEQAFIAESIRAFLYALSREMVLPDRG